MPTYEYACTKCGYHFEQFQSMKDEPLKQCPQCKKPALKRLVGAGAGLIFKGTGFYITDYKKAATPPPGESGGASTGAVSPAAPAPAPKPAAPEKKPVASKSSAKKSSAKR